MVFSHVNGNKYRWNFKDGIMHGHKQSPAKPQHQQPYQQPPAQQPLQQPRFFSLYFI